MSTIITPEAKRFREFCDHLNLTYKVIGSELGKSEPMMSKYMSGTVKIPLTVIKKMNSKYGLSFNWFFTGIGSKVVRNPEKKNVVTDLGYLTQSIHSMEAQIQSQNLKIDKLVRDFYEYKNSHP